MTRFEIAENIRNKPREPIMRFKSHFTYYDDGYKLIHHGIWKLSFRNRIVLTERDVDFWPIISCINFKKYEVITEIGNDDKPSDWEPEEKDTCFVPSLRRDSSILESIKRRFPIWEWNEYLPPNVEPYKYRSA